MIDAPQPTNRKLRRTAAEQADCPTATSVGAHIVRPGNPAAAQTPRATTTPTPEQAPLSKGAGRGASRGLGDCPATATTPTAPAGGQRPGGNPSDLAALGHLPLTREAGTPTATSVGAHIVRPGTPAAAQTPAGGINPAPTVPGDRPATRATANPTPEQAPLSKGAGRGASRGLGDCPATAATSPATAKRAKRRGKGDPTPPTPADIIKLRRRRCADAADIVSFFTKLVAMIALLAVLLGLAFGITPMPNDDMAPRISAGDLLLYYRLADDWANGDVMVFEKDGEQYVGRIVARGGDTVEVTDQATLVVNGSTVLENNIYYTTPKYENGPAYPLTLAAGEFFVLCDYREGARDSRYFGAVRPAEVKGKVITVVRRSGL